ncbi:helix-turn-helix domain-containing protein [Spirillospora sp. CA-294931]|uniref:helix-turn-helix domain-containing protein n=1 Tax=Spirillospora sp. CA-294931 TaxID=3240042 RepID=UPI003D8B9084
MTSTAPRRHVVLGDVPALAAKRDTAEYRAARQMAKLEIALGRAVYQRRTALGISQRELAKRAGMTQPAISRLEAGGGGVPTLAVLDRLGRALGVRFAVTVGDPGDETTAPGDVLALTG